MKEKLKSQLKEAMKAKDQGTMDLIRGLLSAIQYEEIQGGVNELDPATIISVLKRELKKKQEEIEYAEKAGRLEVVEVGKKALATLESFLPKQLSLDQLSEKVKEFIAATPNVNMGGVMKYLKENFDGQYDGRAASEVTKKLLG